MRCGSTNKPQMCDVSSTPYKGRRLLISVPQLRPPLRSDVAPSDLLPHSAHVRPLGVLASSRELGAPVCCSHLYCSPLQPLADTHRCKISAAEFSRLQIASCAQPTVAAPPATAPSKPASAQGKFRWVLRHSIPSPSHPRPPKRPRTHSGLAPAAPCTRCTLLSASHHASVQGPAFLDTSPRLERPRRKPSRTGAPRFFLRLLRHILARVSTDSPDGHQSTPTRPPR